MGGRRIMYCQSMECAFIDTLNQECEFQDKYNHRIVKGICCNYLNNNENFYIRCKDKK